MKCWWVTKIRFAEEFVEINYVHQNHCYTTNNKNIQLVLISIHHKIKTKFRHRIPYLIVEPLKQKKIVEHFKTMLLIRSFIVVYLRIFLIFLQFYLVTFDTQLPFIIINVHNIFVCSKCVWIVYYGYWPYSAGCVALNIKKNDLKKM